MDGSGKISKIFFLIFLTTVLSSIALASGWNIEVLDAPINAFDLSDGDKSIKLVRLETNRGDPITEDMMTNSSEFLYYYNSENGSAQNMTHWRDGLWYAEFESNFSKHVETTQAAQILFEAVGRTKSDGMLDSDNEVTNETQNLVIGDYKMEIISGISSEPVAGRERKVRLNITDRVSGNYSKSPRNVRAYFTNGTWISEGMSFASNDTGKYYYNESFSPPKAENETYVLRIITSNASLQFGKSSISRFINTSPRLSGELTEFSATNGCDNSEMVGRCEPGALVNVKFNVTSSSAEDVNISVYRTNRSSEESVKTIEKSMSRNGDVYQQTFQVPHFNTSEYKRNLKVYVNASNPKMNYSVRKDIQYESLYVQDTTGDYTAEPGEDYSIRFFASKPYSLQRYNKSELEELKLTIRNPDDVSQAELNLSEVNFSDSEEEFEATIGLPEDSKGGRWAAELEAMDDSDSQAVTEWSFSVTTSEELFEVNDTVFKAYKWGQTNHSIQVENLVDRTLDIEAVLSENISEKVNFTEGSQFSIQPESKKSINVTVDPTKGSTNFTETGYEDTEGQVNLTEDASGLTKTAIVLIDTPDCKFLNNSFCSLNEKELNISINQSDMKEVSIGFVWPGVENRTRDVTMESQGEISDYANFPQEEFTIEDKVDSKVEFNSTKRGEYSGNINVLSSGEKVLSYKVDLKVGNQTNASAEEDFLTANVTEIDLGGFPRGSNQSAAITLTNNGDNKLENLTAESNISDVSISNETEISAGGSEEVDIIFSDADDIGEIKISGETSSASYSMNIPATGTAVSNYSSMLGTLASSVQQLRPVSDSNLTQTLSEVQNLLAGVNDDWENGNYLDARQKYRKAQSLVQYVRNNKGQEDESQEQQDEEDDETDTSEGSESGDNQDQGQTGNEQNQSNQNQESGGSNLIFILLVILLLLAVVAVVVYESYIPEEGDPLYGVLGDR